MTESGQQPGHPKRRKFDEVFDHPEGAAELQRLAQKNPEVGRHVAMQERIDDSLRRLFGAPETPVPVALPPSAVKHWVWIRWAAAAAVLLLAAGAGWWFFGRSRALPDVLSPLYQQTVAAGFKPETVCTTDKDFAEWCNSYLGQPIFPISHPKGLEFVGWNVSTTLGTKSGVLLARMDGQPVLVVMARAERQSVRPNVQPSCGLHVSQAKLGKLVLYEISANPDQVVLPTLSADRPK